MAKNALDTRFKNPEEKLNFIRRITLFDLIEQINQQSNWSNLERKTALDIITRPYARDFSFSYKDWKIEQPKADLRLEELHLKIVKLCEKINSLPSTCLNFQCIKGMDIVKDGTMKIFCETTVKCSQLDLVIRAENYLWLKQALNRHRISMACHTNLAELLSDQIIRTTVLSKPHDFQFHLLYREYKIDEDDLYRLENLTALLHQACKIVNGYSGTSNLTFHLLTTYDSGTGAVCYIMEHCQNFKLTS